MREPAEWTKESHQRIQEYHDKSWIEDDDKNVLSAILQYLEETVHEAENADWTEKCYDVLEDFATYINHRKDF